MGHGYAERIAAGLTAYACGDAVGLPYEGRPPTEAGEAEIEALRPRGRWGAGETSDDTALTMLVARCLVERAGAEVPAEQFLAAVAALDPPVKGAGPSTTAAVAQFRATGKVLTDRTGATNGAAMRALPVGWAVPVTEPTRLIEFTVELTRATHRDPDALVAACVVAACGSWALEGAGPRLLLEIAQEAVVAAARAVGTGGGDQRKGGRLAEALAGLGAGTWSAPADGVSLDPTETVVAALACVVGTGSLREALHRAVRLGGDTDTVAALAGGLWGCRMSREEVLAALPWAGRVNLSPAPELIGLADGLAKIRVGAATGAPQARLA